jgi:outer membrane protein assembly factor BamE (lipoprotein component of BamABCDE complex)
MNKYLLLAALVFPAAFASTAFAQIETDDVLRPLASYDTYPGVRMGMSRDEVVAQLGQPSLDISNHVWAYYPFRANDRPTTERHDTLVIVFEQHKVKVLRLTQRSQLQAVLARPRTPASQPVTVAKK